MLGLLAGSSWFLLGATAEFLDAVAKLQYGHRQPNQRASLTDSEIERTDFSGRFKDLVVQITPVLVINDGFYSGFSGWTAPDLEESGVWQRHCPASRPRLPVLSSRGLAG